ncbi:MAG: lysophospholipid acyltransferase family protein [Verrucomicrobia bacterium]|nr:lysophospholipid acyltransferase family protein [Cytophagales bacterium]
MLFLRLLAKLPFPVLYFISDTLFIVIFYMASYRRKVVFENLSRAFPDRTPQQIKQLSRKFYRNLTDIIVETLKLLSITPEELRRRVAIKNLAVLNHFLSREQTVVVMTSHQCNWEWILVRCALDMTAIADGIYKPLTNPFFEKIMRSIRTRFNTHLVPAQQLPRSLVSRKNIPRAIALVADQIAAPESAYWTDFLNQDTAFFAGGAKIAVSQQLPIVFVEMKRISRGFYEINLSLLAEPPYQASKMTGLIEKYVRTAEKSILQNPADWLWSHRRWKHSRKTTLVTDVTQS